MRPSLPLTACGSRAPRHPPALPPAIGASPEGWTVWPADACRSHILGRTARIAGGARGGRASPLCCWQPGAAASCSLRSRQQPIHPSGPCERLSPSTIDACLPACLPAASRAARTAAGNRRASVGHADASPRGRPRGWPPAAAPRSTPRAHGIVDATVLAAAAAAAEPHATHPHGQQRPARRQSSGIDHGIPPTPAVAVSRTAPRTHGVDVIMIDAAVLAADSCGSRSPRHPPALPPAIGASPEGWTVWPADACRSRVMCRTARIAGGARGGRARPRAAGSRRSSVVQLAQRAAADPPERALREILSQRDQCLPAYQQRLAPPAPPPATGAPQWAMRTLAREVGREAGRLLQRHAALHGRMASWMRPSLPPRQRQRSPMPLTRMASSNRRDSVGLADASPAGLTMGYRRRLL